LKFFGPKAFQNLRFSGPKVFLAGKTVKKYNFDQKAFQNASFSGAMNHDGENSFAKAF
jgi:hypothetical protein